jgi:hypothetical protein
VQPRALVLGGNTGQAVGGFKCKFFHKLDNHCASILALRLEDSQTSVAQKARDPRLDLRTRKLDRQPESKTRRVL